MVSISKLIETMTLLKENVQKFTEIVDSDVITERKGYVNGKIDTYEKDNKTVFSVERLIIDVGFVIKNDKTLRKIIKNFLRQCEQCIFTIKRDSLEIVSGENQIENMALFKCSEDLMTFSSKNEDSYFMKMNEFYDALKNYQYSEKVAVIFSMNSATVYPLEIVSSLCISNARTSLIKAGKHYNVSNIDINDYLIESVVIKEKELFDFLNKWRLSESFDIIYNAETNTLVVKSFDAMNNQLEKISIVLGDYAKSKNWKTLGLSINTIKLMKIVDFFGCSPIAFIDSQNGIIVSRKIGKCRFSTIIRNTCINSNVTMKNGFVFNVAFELNKQIKDAFRIMKSISTYVQIQINKNRVSFSGNDPNNGNIVDVKLNFENVNEISFGNSNDEKFFGYIAMDDFSRLFDEIKDTSINKQMRIMLENNSEDVLVTFENDMRSTYVKIKKSRNSLDITSAIENMIENNMFCTVFDFNKFKQIINQNRMKRSDCIKQSIYSQGHHLATSILDDNMSIVSWSHLQELKNIFKFNSVFVRQHIELIADNFNSNEIMFVKSDIKNKYIFSFIDDKGTRIAVTLKSLDNI